MDPLINILIWLLIVFMGGWMAHWVIERFIPAEAKMPALFIVGVLLLIAILLIIFRGAPVAFNFR